MYTIWLNRNYTDTQTGEQVEVDPLFLELTYSSTSEASAVKSLLEQIYGQGKIEIDCLQEYQARMGRY